jgi:hypothetical protein
LWTIYPAILHHFVELESCYRSEHHHLTHSLE